MEKNSFCKAHASDLNRDTQIIASIFQGLLAVGGIEKRHFSKKKGKIPFIASLFPGSFISSTLRKQPDKNSLIPNLYNFLLPPQVTLTKHRYARELAAVSFEQIKGSIYAALCCCCTSSLKIDCPSKNLSFSLSFSLPLSSPSILSRATKMERSHFSRDSLSLSLPK